MFADIFDLFNQRRILDYDAWTELGLGVPNPDFGTAKNSGGSFPQFQSPVAVRVGARFQF